jgi:hypothetical protein
VQASDCDPVSSDDFADAAAEWSEKRGVTLEGVNGRVYLIGVRLIA